MVLLRRLLGDALRRTRQRQQRTLREVSSAARVSLGYLSEVERGQKEPSSELLAAICDALEVELSDVLREISATLEAERADQAVPVGAGAEPAASDGQPTARAAARVVVEPVVIERAALPADEPPALEPLPALSPALSAALPATLPAMAAALPPNLPPTLPAVPVMAPEDRHGAQCRAPVTVAA
jgi:transcriptional regulator with XRE-family HTH domain